MICRTKTSSASTSAVPPCGRHSADDVHYRCRTLPIVHARSPAFSGDLGNQSPAGDRQSRRCNRRMIDTLKRARWDADSSGLRGDQQDFNATISERVSSLPALLALSVQRRGLPMRAMLILRRSQEKWRMHMARALRHVHLHDSASACFNVERRSGAREGG